MILRRHRPGRLGPALLLAVVLVLAGWSRSFAHDIPSRVTVFAFVKPQGRVLRVILRVPLAAMRDVNFPTLGEGYLDERAASPLLADAVKVWIAGDLQFYEEGTALPPPTIAATRVSLPSDRSFSSYAAALAHARAPLVAVDSDLVWQQAMLDAVLEYPITSDRAHFSVRPTLARLGVRTTTVLRVVTPDGTERAFEYIGDPGLVRLDPRWYQAARSFVALGIEHILSGIDHLLFLLCLVIPFRRIRPLITVVTAFTIAHSITLIASAAGFAPSALWFPPLIEAVIALSIVYMAIENIIGAKLERRWLMTFGFGLVHGFGFSFALRESLQFAGSHLALSLVSFNVGVEIGQLLVLAAMVPALGWLFSHVVAERMGTIILSAFVAHTAWHWTMDRGAVLAQYHIELPALDAAFAASVMRGLILLLCVGAVAWALSFGYRRLIPSPSGGSPETPV